MRVERLWLTDFRNYESADVSPAPGLTVVVGDNGEGKTNLLEAVGYLATLGSFRGAPRDALVRQAAGGGGRLSGDLATTLEVWDERLADAGERLGAARADLCRRLEPLVAKCYAQVAGNGAHVGLTYEAPWREPGLAAALVEARADELRRGISLVGPHRDDVGLSVDGLPARTHASQGEQRSLALALRLGAHTLVTDVIGIAPVLLLDDIFSELDADRSAALVAHLPDAQALLATTAGVPAGARADLVLRVSGGRIA